MRSAAPPVRFLSFEGQRVWRAAQVGLACLAASIVCAWQLHGLAPDWSALLVALSVLTAGVAGVLILRATPRPAAVELNWDGARWTLDGAAVAIEVRIDLCSGVLLRCAVAPEGRIRWVWLWNRDRPEAWHALRVALFARAVPADGLPAGTR